MDLLQKMVAGSPQFVRCIKPNDSKAARTFETGKVLKQLRYTGVLETIRIRQHGFSHRYTFADFLKRYCFLAFGFDEKVLVTRENCRLLLVRLKMDGWALGKSKVFLKYYHVEFLAKLFEEQVNIIHILDKFESNKQQTINYKLFQVRKVVIVQACVRRWLARIMFRKNICKVSSSAVILQRHVRGWLTRRRVEVLKKQEREKRERIERERREEQLKREAESKARISAIKEKIIRKMNSQERLAAPFERKSELRKNKENINEETAASVIQNRKQNKNKI